MSEPFLTDTALNIRINVHGKWWLEASGSLAKKVRHDELQPFLDILKERDGEQAVIGVYVEIYRKYKLKMTQIELAKALGISQSALSKIETGVLNFTVETALKFCKKIKVRVEDFYDRS